MFAISDQIIYGSVGVCTIIGIQVPDMPHATKECYVLKPHYIPSSKIYAPVDGSRVKMRALHSKAQLHSLLCKLPQIPAFSADTDKKGLYETYRNALQSTDSLLLAKLTKTLYQKKQHSAEQKKIIPTVEKEYLDTAEQIFNGEVATVLDIPLEDVPEYIGSFLDGTDAERFIS